MTTFILLTLLTIWVIATGFYIVQPEHFKTITFLGGKFTRVGGEGFHLKLPWPIEIVDKTGNLKLHSKEENIQIKTSDNSYMNLPVSIFYRIENTRKSTVRAACYKIDNPIKEIMELAKKSVRSAVNELTMEEVFKDKEKLEAEVIRETIEFSKQYGIVLDKVVINEPIPDDDYIQASNRVLASQRELEASKNEAEVIKVKRVGEAIADAEALKERAKAHGESREIIIEGIVKGIQRAREDENITLTDQEITKALEGVDMRDAIISASKGKGTVIITSPSANQGQDSQIANLTSLVKSLENKEQ